MKTCTSGNKTDTSHCSDQPHCVVDAAAAPTPVRRIPKPNLNVASFADVVQLDICCARWGAATSGSTAGAAGGQRLADGDHARLASAEAEAEERRIRVDLNGLT